MSTLALTVLPTSPPRYSGLCYELSYLSQRLAMHDVWVPLVLRGCSHLQRLRFQRLVHGGWLLLMPCWLSLATR